jgi:hypothetical protein
LLALLGSALGTPLFAQERPPVSLEVSAGVSFGRGGVTRRERNGVALDATLGWRVYPVPNGAVLLALSGGAQGAIGMDMTDDCQIAPGGGCLPDYPSFYSVGALAGWEWALERGASTRVLAGPAYYRGHQRRPDVSGRAIGLQARADFTTPTLRRIALLASLRAAVVPSFRGDTYALGAAGFGFRFQ